MIMYFAVTPYYSDLVVFRARAEIGSVGRTVEGGTAGEADALETERRPEGKAQWRHDGKRQPRQGLRYALLAPYEKMQHCHTWDNGREVPVHHWFIHEGSGGGEERVLLALTLCLTGLCHRHLPGSPPLWQCQSQAWMKEEGNANDLCYFAVLLNSDCCVYQGWREREGSTEYILARAFNNVNTTIYIAPSVASYFWDAL